MDKKRYCTKILTFAKKKKSVDLLGGKCEICGETNIFKLVFHHKGDKDYSFNKIKSHRWSKLKKEILKCTLLCSNCHRELHFNEKEPVDRRSRENKTILLKYIGKMKCEICGYDKCNGSLDFHHKDNKEHNISDLIGKQKYSVENLLEWVDEVNKCEIICANCHKETHVDKDFYNKNYDLIIEKSKNMTERPETIDKKKVLEMYKSGMTQKEIRIELNVAKSTISGIVKQLKQNGNIKEK